MNDSSQRSLHQLSAWEIHKSFLDGTLSAIEITKYFLHRITSFDDKTQAFLSVFSNEAIEQAEILDKKRDNGEALGKLAAVPVAIKDNIQLKTFTTSCASKFLENYTAPFSATAISYLEKEDAIFIGKTNLDEFAMGSSTEHSAYQKSYNPWDLAYVPGGSSGGSAVAVAARLCPISLGSDTGGSVRQPASFCGCYGYKPSYGRISRYGLVAFGSSFDQIGPLANDVKDLALALDIMGKPCKKDATCIQKKNSDIYPSLSEEPGKVRTYGIPRSFLKGLNDEMNQHFSETLKQLESQGHTLVDVDLDILKYSIATYYILATAEASTNLARFDGIRYGHRSSKARSLDEVYDLSKEEGFGYEVKKRILLGTFVLSAGYQDAYYRKAQKIRTLMIKSFSQAFETCEAIILPTSPTPAFKQEAIIDPIEMYLSDLYTLGANLAGLPAISIPCNLSSRGLPIGFQILGPHNRDALVLQAAYAYQKDYPFNFFPKEFS